MGVGIGATLTPENRGQAAIAGAAGGTVGEILGSALTSGLVTLGPKARALFTYPGIEPSLGDIMKEGGPIQRGLGVGVRAIERSAEKLPLIGSKLPISRMRAQSQQSFKGLKKELTSLDDESLNQMARESLRGLKPTLTKPPTPLSASDLLTFGGIGGAGYAAPIPTAIAGTGLALFPRTSA